MAYDFTDAELAAIRANYVALCKAIAMGVTVFQHEGKKVEYDSVADMLKAKVASEDMLGITPTSAAVPRTSTASFYR
jgi:hypothetical protein